MGLTGRNRGLVRQWKLLLALDAAPRGLSWAQLMVAADELVSLRTLRRDIDTLTFAGFPIDVESNEGFQTTRIFLRRQEWRGGQVLFPTREREQVAH